MVGFTMSATALTFVKAKCGDDPAVSEVIERARRRGRGEYVLFGVPRDVAVLIERELRTEVLARQLSAKTKNDINEADVLATGADRILSKLDGYT